MSVTDDRIKTLYPGLRPLCYRVLEDVYRLTHRRMNVVDATRTFTQQLQDYAKGRRFVISTGEVLPSGTIPVQNTTGKWEISDRGSIVTNARPGMSWHNYGLAFDAAWAGTDPYLQKDSEDDRDELWATYADLLFVHGFRAGAKFRLVNGVRDRPHAEMPYSLTLDQAMELHNHGGIDSVWAYLDQVRGVPEGQDWRKT